MQLFATKSYEHGEHAGLGWIAGEVRPIDAPGLRVPHVGWNDVTVTHAHALAAPGTYYFVHGYHFVATDPAHVLATTDYGGPLAAIVGREKICGTQFHPEKSQKAGLALLRAFAERIAC
jgi:glutamine amidotransferase